MSCAALLPLRFSSACRRCSSPCTRSTAPTSDSTWPPASGSRAITTCRARRCSPRRKARRLRRPAQSSGDAVLLRFRLPSPRAMQTPVAARSASTSRGASRRAAPLGRSPSRNGPTATRRNSTTIRPTTAHIRRTCRFRPSTSVIRSHDPGSRARNSTRAGSVRFPCTSTPPASVRAATASTGASSRTSYTFSTCDAGSVSAAASCVSLVNRSKPEEARSSRPTAPRCGLPAGNKSYAVGRPCGSRRVVT